MSTLDKGNIGVSYKGKFDVDRMDTLESQLLRDATRYIMRGRYYAERARRLSKIADGARAFREILGLV